MAKNCADVQNIMEAALLVVANADLLRQWVNGDEHASVTLGGVLTPSIRKLVATIDARESAAAQRVIDQGLARIELIARQSANNAAEAKEHAERACACAQQAGNFAEAAAGQANRAGTYAGIAAGEANRAREEADRAEAFNPEALRLHVNHQFSHIALTDAVQAERLWKLQQRMARLEAQDATTGDNP